MKPLFLFLPGPLLMWLCASPTAPKMAQPQVATLVGPVVEAKIADLLPGYTSSDKFEASGVAAVGNYFYVVCDNRDAILSVYKTLRPHSNVHAVIGIRTESPSGFEAITYNAAAESFFVTIENQANNGEYSPRVREYSDIPSFEASLWADYTFGDDEENKGFEGNAALRRNGTDYLLGLCEGTGNIIVTKKTSSEWQYVATIAPPVAFTDYSDIDIRNNRVLISSQEDSKLWVGTLSSTSWAFVGAGTVYNFPRGGENGVVGGPGFYKLYANIEGVSWIDDNTFVAVSDKASGKDPAYMKYKDQSIHIFKLK